MFKYLIILTATIIAGAAAYFSIFGLVQVYTGIALPIIIMGSALEIGKLVAASFLYRYWEKISLLLKTYLIISVLTLMLITSIGIFGYLTASYQKDTLPIKETNQILERNKIETDRLMFRKTEIDKQISELPKNFVNGRKQLLNTFKPELDTINKQIDLLQKQTSELQSKKLNTETHIGPIMFVAKVLKQDPDDSIFYFTLLIMLVFDPLAVALTLCANIIIKDSGKNIPASSKEDEEDTKKSDNPSIAINDNKFNQLLNIQQRKEELLNKSRV